MSALLYFTSFGILLLVLVSWGMARPGENALRVTFHGETSDVPVTNGYYVWMVESVTRADIDDPAEFQPAP
jgi:hypothetical protein